ncbi:MAG: GNAT family N-acetyltransferase [Spirochaetales bacterium]
MKLDCIRPFNQHDRTPIGEILRSTHMFTQEEVAVAMELIDTFLQNPYQKDYLLYTAEAQEKAVGYVCYGPTPATEGTFDLYWIAVDPSLQNSGVGTQLLLFTEEQIKKAGGRLIIIETSSQEKYQPTRIFYERKGYTLEARIKDFYRLGDDRLIYTKRF